MLPVPAGKRDGYTEMIFPAIIQLTLLKCFLLFSGVKGESALNQKNYPVPPSNDNSLFYIQRSSNTNAIVYESNIRKDGTIDEENPVKIYWLRFSEDSTTADLNYIQRKYAYGIDAHRVDDQKNRFVLNFVSYAKKNLYLMAKPNGKFAAYMSINGKMAELKRVWIQLNGGTFWFPTIEYVELVGKDPSTQQTVTERFKPRR